MSRFALLQCFWLVYFAAMFYNLVLGRRQPSLQAAAFRVEFVQLFEAGE